MFDRLIYKDEDLNKAESLTIYLINIDELSTEVQDESTVIKQLEKFIQTNFLDKEERKKKLEFFRKKELLFINNIQKLEKTNVIIY
ncbi:14311_t:CDS:2 [Cetraspora pellucida]|uniref:14311_t:CDS:1 n=1 Tax=Cetraspora pellucida TaxID=1433469 RepID=A0A9N9CTF0_9GLOM|nr:14311_t:CDS:2 [Cetraspora pellucida]